MSDPGCPELAPANTAVPVENERRMGRSGPNTIELPFAVEGRRSSPADPLGMKPHAPATAKDAAVALHQRHERGLRRLIESLDGIRRFDHEPSLTGWDTRQAARPDKH